MVILTRSGCCLCDDAVAAAQRICAPRGIPLVLQDVDADPGLRAIWNDHVPVTFVDGRQFDIWKLDEGRLARALGADQSDSER